MPSRRWWIVLVLAAVFSMHGVLLISPSGEAGATEHSMAGSSIGGSLPDMAGALLPGAVADIMATGDMPMPDTDTGHGGGAHLWSLCLAILAGMSLLGAVMLSGRVAGAVAGAAVHLLRGVGRWPGLTRPPTLAALCLLRI